MTSPWEMAAASFERATTLDLEGVSRALDPRTVWTPALQLISDELEVLVNTPDARLLISMPPQEGKLVADDTLVPTPGGWVKHGDLRIDDEVFGLDGSPIRVLHVHEPSVATLRVHFSDHGHVDVHPNHEWTLWDRARGAERTVETRYLLSQRLSSGEPGRRGHRYRFQLPYRAPLTLPDADLPIDPYTLGVWLGDGSTNKAAVTHHPNDLYVLAYPASASCVHPMTGIVTTYYRGGLHTDLRAAGVFGAKHIPAAYLRASEAQRRALLAGLIDTDGHVAASGQVSFDNANRALVESTAELIRTLGYRAHVHVPTSPKLSTSGIQGVQEMWRVTYTPHDVGPARLERKAAKKLGIRRRVAITGIEEIDPRPGRCITVDAPDGLYLVGETMIPTHNSTLAAKAFPLAVLRRNPDTRIVVGSYGHTLARKSTAAVRDALKTHPEFGLKVRPDISAKDEWQLDGHLGGMFAAGVGTSLTGRPTELVLIDDPHKDAQEADSETMRENVWDWWQSTVSSRFAPGAQVCIIGTRWHEDDLIGRLIAQDDDGRWRVVNIPAQADHDPEKGETDVLGREPGEYMQSARRRTTRQWEIRKKEAGPRGWDALYQGRPTPSEGGLFKRDSWKRYASPLWIEYENGTRFVPGEGMEIVQSWDLAFKDTTKSDFVVGQVWMRRGVEAYLLDQTRARMSFTETCSAIAGLSARWPQARGKLIEDKANGPAVMEFLNKTIPGLIPVTPRESKQARAAAITPFVDAGNVWLPSETLLPWSEDLVQEAAGFPLGAHDDQVDALSQALNHLMNNPWLNFDDVLEPEEFTIADMGWGISRY